MNIYNEYSFNGLKTKLTKISLKESCVYILMVWFYISKQNKYSYLQKCYEPHFWFTNSTSTVLQWCDIFDNSHPTSDWAEVNSDIY